MKYKNIFVNTSFYFFASLLRAVLSLAINPLIAMNMTHYDYALTGFYTSFNSLLLPIFSLMYGQYYAKRYFLLKTDEEREELANDLTISRFIFNFFEIIFILIAFSVYAHIQKIAFPVYPYAIITFTSIIFNSVYSFYLLMLKMGKRVKEFFLISCYGAIMQSGLSVLLIVVFKLGALGKLSAILITAIFFTVVLLPKMLHKIRINKELTIDAIKFCWPLMIAGSLGYFLTGIDRALLVGLDDTYELGLYNVAISISGYLMIFQTSLNDTFQPDIFEAVTKNNKKKIFGVFSGIILLNTIPIIAFIVFAPFVIKILTADRFTDAYQYARVLALRNISAGIFYSISGLIIAYGYTGISLINKIIGSILSVLLFKFLISNFEFYGAAWGQVLSFVLMTLVSVSVIFLKRKKIIKFRQVK